MDKYGSSNQYPPYGYPPQNQPYPSHSPPPPNQPYPSHSSPPNQPYPSHSPPPLNQQYPPLQSPPPPQNQPYPPPPQNQPYPPPPQQQNQPYPPPQQQNQPYPPPPQQNQPYPPPPQQQNQPYPPPGSPPRNSVDGSSGLIPTPTPGPQGQYAYPYAAFYQYPHGKPGYQYPYPYPQHGYYSQHPRLYSFSGPLPQTSGGLPSLQHSISFSHQGGSHLQHHDFGVYPSPGTQSHPPTHANSFVGGVGGDNPSTGVSSNGEGNRPSNVSVYPPLDNLMADMKLNDGRLSAPASPPAPALAKLESFGLAYPGVSGNMGGTPALAKVESFAYSYPSPTGSSSPYGTHHSGHSRTSSWDGSIPSLAASPRLTHYDSSNHMQLVPFHKGSLKVLLLHGNLDIWVYEAKNLPNMDLFHKTLGDVFCKLPGGMVSKIEGSVSRTITSDPYVSITISNAVIGRTYVISNEENPIWMQHFNVPVAHNAAEVHFLVKDSDVVGSQLIGSVSIPVEQLYSGVKIENTYPILNANGRQCKAGAVLSLSIQYIPIKNLSMYHHGVGAGPDYHGVLGTYFPLRRGGMVTLYQDAHVPDGCLPDIFLEGGRKYEHGKCWRDIFDAIRQAKRLIYITGWSVWHKVRLVRDNPSSDCTLGELLRSKSAEGVRVLLLVWDDPTSRSILGYRTDGIMATHDEETRRYFKHSSVQVLLCPRVAGKRHSWYKQTEISTIYTHHQKTVIVDVDAGKGKRKIISFVGGLDLCDGRYDSPEHALFRTLDKEHKDDYHNPCLPGNTTGCPREPWHDLHCRIDGPAAYDVLTNFQERWMRASKPHGIKKLKGNYDDALLRIERLPDIVGISETPWLNEYDPESWHVQVFRSIDSSSVKGFPKNPKEATSRNLVCGKNVLIDMSIHTAYVKAIRAAQHYIYIENQYFIGSSFNWSQHKELGADNLIPMEIALKIAEKIRNHERFTVYIVIPMWPEGIPNATATQRILYWQNKTMQMMYETIHKALVEVGLEDSYTPQDYLNFFCLGNREVSSSGSQPVSGSPPHPPNSPQALCTKHRRFMIYVHSKGMIVDDEYVILGSANINQRSMEGTRDTEIAMGAYQPHYTWARKGCGPRGQVYGYRMSLWAEHLGIVDDCFNAPDSLECVRKVRTLSEMNWTNFAAETPTVMLGHLLKYPVDVDRRGKVKPLPGCENFPDLGGNICGSFNGIAENLTI